MGQSNDIGASTGAYDRFSTLAAAMLCGSVALVALGAQPTFLGLLVESGRLQEAGVGQVAMVEVLGLTIGAMAGPFLIARRIRLKMALLSLVLIISNLAIFIADAPLAIMLQRGVAGLIEGLMVGAVNLVITHSSRPERMSGIFLAISAIPQMAAAYLLPAIGVPLLGMDAAFIVLAAIAFLSILGSLAMPDRVDPHHDTLNERVRWSAPLVVVIIAIVLQNAGMGSAWSYVDRLGHQRGFAADAIGIAVALGLAGQVIGSLLAAWVGHRLPTKGVLVIGAFIQVVILALVAVVHAPVPFATLLLVFGIIWPGLNPFLVMQLISLDRTRRAAVMMGPMILVGQAGGSLFVSFAVGDKDVVPAFWTALVMVALATLCFVVGIAFRRVSGIAEPPATLSNAPVVMPAASHL